jgi:hypothetical protein
MGGLLLVTGSSLSLFRDDDPADQIGDDPWKASR